MDLKKIDLDILQDYAFTPEELEKEPMVSRKKFINIGCLDNESIVPTVQAIPLDKVKQAREEIDQAYEEFAVYDPFTSCGYSARVDVILDKLIAEN